MNILVLLILLSLIFISGIILWFTKEVIIMLGVLIFLLTIIGPIVLFIIIIFLEPLRCQAGQCPNKRVDNSNYCQIHIGFYNQFDTFNGVI